MRTFHTSTKGSRRHFAAGLQAAVAIAVVSALTGCANITDVRSENQDGSYNLRATGLSYTMSMADLTAVSRQKASAWCDGQGKDMQLRQQSRGWSPMQVDLNFRCLPRNLSAKEQPLSLAEFK